MLHKYSLGQDDRQVQGDKERKSVSAEVNYGIRFTNENEAVRFLHELSEEVKKRMDAISVKGRCVSLKLMVRRSDAPTETAKFMGHGICNTSNKSSNLPVATNDADLISREVIAMFRMQNIKAIEIRGIGIQITKLEHPVSVAQAKALRGKSGHQSILQFTVPQHKLNNTDSVRTNLNDTLNTSSGLKIHSATHVKNPTYTHGNDIGISDQAGNTNLIELKGTYSSKIDQSKPGGSKEPDSPLLSPINELTENAHLIEPKGTKMFSMLKTSLPKPGCSKDPDSPPPLSIDIPATDERLSMSQIDQQVLASLPPDIAKEVLSNLSADTQNPSTSDVNMKNIDLSPSKRPKNNSLDISFSQVDQDIFNELPVELQDEIRNEYSRGRVTRASTKDSVAAVFQEERGVQQSRSPKKLGNNFKTPHVPVTKIGKKKRGRPPGKSKLQPSDNKRTVSKQALNKQIIVLDENDEDVVLVSYDGQRMQSLRKTSSSDDHLHISHPENMSDVCPTSAAEESDSNEESPPSLCGAVSISEVRSLLKEWIHSVPEPQEEDLNQVKDYMTSLVLQRNLEQVFYLLRFLFRVTDKGNSKNHSVSKWGLASKDISNHIQSVVSSVHGATLKLRKF